MAGAALAESEELPEHLQLIELNAHWASIEPDFSSLPEGFEPDNQTSWIQAHLFLTLDRLRKAETSDLDDRQRSQRKQHIANLEIYARRGQFPINTFTGGRRPVFIDAFGTHCAVGQLMLDSGHGELAARINAEHRLDFLRDIRTPGLEHWRKSSGLSLDELALIQPGYHSWELNYPAEVEYLFAGETERVIEWIKKKPSLTNDRCGGKTLLHYAAAAGNLEVCKRLVARGADINAKTKKTWKSKYKKHPEYDIGRMSSSTKVSMKWNRPSEVMEGPGDIGQIGMKGVALKTVPGQLIVKALN
ncbi:MAG: ankyrin repeat domain-containing protein, partial [Verrucomicrobiota bacterium]